jgi:uncharacterized protein YaeQ
MHMALSATIYKFDIDLNDLDRNHYAFYSHHVALHPSETVERMVIRILAFCLNASETLTFTKGLSTDSEPDLWQKNYSDDIELWIELGTPDDKRIKKACNQSDQVILYAYGGQGVDTWWNNFSKHAYKFENLAIYRIDLAMVEKFTQGLERTMALSCMIQDGQITLSANNEMYEFSLELLKEAKETS